MTLRYGARYTSDNASFEPLPLYDVLSRQSKTCTPSLSGLSLLLIPCGGSTTHGGVSRGEAETNRMASEALRWYSLGKSTGTHVYVPRMGCGGVIKSTGACFQVCEALHLARILCPRPHFGYRKMRSMGNVPELLSGYRGRCGYGCQQAQNCLCDDLLTKMNNIERNINLLEW
ncbi:hypothetical protein P280DRAFT_131065 [Massarina eburnea CBS 473.64]|uniref:Uncharacterized protein n=1 Tax=Massarina eburnea CBS 473.64 TaxID=1395130 RepID=A0A6A6SEA3_9PLEO|nr:hypothetical protein P280DRAFT_131065 [Massarina eburnea CBS 473.64]